jgi:hypothetical protein
MTAIGKEAGVCTSTVSRAILKFQGWGIFAVDVTRGRNGGITVTLRRFGDHLQHYAIAAWARIKNAALNVAFTLTKRVEGVRTEYVPMDATFSGGDRDQERIVDLGARIRSGEITIEQATGGSRRATDADREWAKAEEWARQVIAERQRLDREEPDWDLELEKVRASYGFPADGIG